MQITAAQIIALARQAQVPFGAHAFIVVQENGGFFAEQCDIVGADGVEAARTSAQNQVAYRKHRQPSLDFHVLEVGAPVNGADLIRQMADLIDGAIDAHIYDEGDEVPDDCAYHAAVRDAEAFLASPSAFDLPPIGALEVIRDLEGSLSELDQQIDQMKGMFPDDETIDEAQEEAAEALQRAKMYREAVGQPIQLFVKVDGGTVQDVTCDRDLPGVEVRVIDSDVTEEDEALVEVEVRPGRWETARNDIYPITVEPAPNTREIAEEGAAE